MLSRQTRVAVLTAKAARKYAPTILETAALLQELIDVMRVVDPIPKRVQWPKRIRLYLHDRQNGVCAACLNTLPEIGEGPSHVDHVVPWAQGGDNSEYNICLLHGECNQLKADECSPDDVIRHLELRLYNLRAVSSMAPRIELTIFTAAGRPPQLAHRTKADFDACYAILPGARYSAFLR